MTAYPSKDKIEEIFADRDRPEVFNSYLSPHVDTTIAGEEFHLGGKYKTVDHLHNAIWDGFMPLLKLETLRLEVLHVIGGGDSSWCAVQTLATAETKTGKPFYHEWVDLVRFNSEGKIAQMKEFFDTKMVHGHLDDHESSKSKEEEKPT